MVKIGFDNQKYIETQSKHIKDRIDKFGGKLYLEFGGKLFDDYHASRVLPGFAPDSKIRMLLALKERAEIVIVISADDIEKSKQRGDLGITYDNDVVRLLDIFTEIGLFVGSVVITRWRGQHIAEQFEKKLKNRGVKVYRHYPIEGYPTNLELIISEDGYGKNDYVETTRPLVVITAPGPGSGKMAVCLSQLYHEHKRGIKAGYAKFETFPIWNLRLNHPVNLAYEAATADLDDVNMIDHFHLDAYGVQAVNYNRDIEIFPVLEAMFKKIYGNCPYKSPTDMGVNMAGFCISDDAAVCEASKQEIIRRYYTALCNVKLGIADQEELDSIDLIMKMLDLTPTMRPTVLPAHATAERTGGPAVALELPDGTILTGKTSSLLGASSAVLFNALKYLADIDDSIRLISPEIIEPIQKLKTGYMGNHNPRLHTDEALIALSICGTTDKNAEKAFNAIAELRGSELHSTVALSPVDLNVFRKLGVNVTCEPKTKISKLRFEI